MSSVVVMPGWMTSVEKARGDDLMSDLHEPGIGVKLFGDAALQPANAEPLATDQADAVGFTQGLPYKIVFVERDAVTEGECC